MYYPLPSPKAPPPLLRKRRRRSERKHRRTQLLVVGWLELCMYVHPGGPDADGTTCCSADVCQEFNIYIYPPPSLKTPPPSHGPSRFAPLRKRRRRRSLLVVA